MGIITQLKLLGELSELIYEKKRKAMVTLQHSACYIEMYKKY